MLFLTPIDAWRWLVALGIVLTYLVLCWRQLLLSRAGALAIRPFVPNSPADGSPDARTEAIWVVYASQTGQAEALARQSLQALSAPQRRVHLCRLDDDWQSRIGSARCVLFVVSTYGEGSAPDHALRFANERLANPAGLRGLRYGLLALGDRNYPAFCAFGRQLDAWLQASGAQAEFARVEADRLDAHALAQWQQGLQALGGRAPTARRSTGPDYAPWRLLARECLNAGSPGNPIHRVVLEPVAGDLPVWQAGDLVDVLIPDGDGVPRAYSIANLPQDGRIELIVRKQIRADGMPGLASGWLTETAPLAAQLALKIRSNPSFHWPQDLARPLILIGAGAGIAGLRAHLQARAEALQAAGQAAPPKSAWLFFGERSGRHDHLCRLEIAAWRQAGVLSRVDLSFSRDDPVTPYIQHNLLAQAKDVSDWLASGAQILICGNASKMAVGVDKALRRILGSAEVDRLLESGRIRRDVF